MHVERVEEEGTARLDLGQIEQLTFGETLLIDRRRRGENQEAAGIRLSLPKNTYAKIERDEVSGDHRMICPDIGELEVHEKCFLYRRRSKKTQEQCADEMGISRYWFDSMELGKACVDRLAEYWEC